MSHTAASTNEGSTQAAKAASTGRAVLLLALFVVLGVALLNAIDDPTAETAVIARPAPEVTVPAIVTPATVPTRLPSDVKVLVANGVGVDGAASRVASRLQPMGYLLVTPGNTTSPSPSSAVAYTEGFQAEAQALATSLALAANSVQPLNPAQVPALDGANLVVIVGNDLATAPPAPVAAPTNGAAGATGAIGGSGAVTTVPARQAGISSGGAVVTN